LGDGGDGERAAAVHEPGDEIGSIAAEIEEGSGSIAFRVGEPGEEFRRDADFLGTLVAVVYDDFADVSDGFAAAGERIGGVVAAIPGGFVVDEHLDVALAGGLLDGAGVFEADGEGFFHHDVDATGGAGLDDAEMIEGVREDQDGFRPGFVEHLFEVGVEEGGREFVAAGVTRGEPAVGLGDAYEVHVVAVEVPVEESGGVAVVESGDGEGEVRNFAKVLDFGAGAVGVIEVEGPDAFGVDGGVDAGVVCAAFEDGLVGRGDFGDFEVDVMHGAVGGASGGFVMDHEFDDVAAFSGDEKLDETGFAGSGAEAPEFLEAELGVVKTDSVV